jgi:hypothetical protein
MNFDLPYKHIGPVPRELLEQAELGVIDLEASGAYNFKHGEWLRLDSYYNPDNHELSDIVGSGLVDHVMSFFPGEKLFGWSVSHIPPHQPVIDHADRMFFHRFAKRIIVPINDVGNNVLNWHWSWNDTRRCYFFEYGNIYRLNTAWTHGVKNSSNQVRRAVYFDVMETKFYDKFITHPDILTVILANAAGEKYVL